MEHSSPTIPALAAYIVQPTTTGAIKGKENKNLDSVEVTKPPLNEDGS